MLDVFSQGMPLLFQNHLPPDFTKAQVDHSSLRTTSGYAHFSDGFEEGSCGAASAFVDSLGCGGR